MSAKPRTLEALGPGELSRAASLLDRAGHDVAKYMAMTARNVDPAGPAPDELEMVRRDLLETDGARPSWEIWAPVSRALAELSDDPELAAIDAAMARLEALVVGGPERAAELVEAAVETADRIARLRRAVRRRLEQASVEP